MSRLNTLLCLVITATFSTSIHADALVFNNASFSTLPAGGLDHPNNPGGNFDVGTIYGWTEAGSSAMGQWQPNSTDFNYLPDGSTTIAYSNGGTIFQNIGVVQAGMNYTLTVDIGNRLDGWSSTDAMAALLINGQMYYATGTIASPGDWSAYTVTYTALASDVNHEIAIMLIEAGTNGHQGDFADVQLSDAVPEPSTGLFVGLGIAFLAISRRLIRLSGKLRGDLRLRSNDLCHNQMAS